MSDYLVVDKGVKLSAPSKGTMVVVPSSLGGLSTFDRRGRSAFFLVLKPFDFLGGGASSIVDGLFLMAAFSANALDVGAFFWKQKDTS